MITAHYKFRQWIETNLIFLFISDMLKPLFVDYSKLPPSIDFLAPASVLYFPSILLRSLLRFDRAPSPISPSEAPRVGLGNTEPEPKSSKEALSPWGQARVYMSLLSLHFPIVFSPVLDLVFHLIGSSFECIFGPKSIAQFSFTVHSCKALRVELNVPRQCHRQSRKSHI